MQWKDLDFKNSRVKLARNKTGVRRNFPLWPETIKALKELPRSGQLVFNTSQGQPWVTTVVKTNVDGERKYTSVNRITPTFSRLMKKVRINAPKGTGFYALRRTAATMAARSGDPFAVQRLPSQSLTYGILNKPGHALYVLFLHDLAAVPFNSLTANIQFFCDCFR